VTYTGDQASVAQGDNFLSMIVPEIEASQAYKNNGAIILSWHESEGGYLGIHDSGNHHFTGREGRRLHQQHLIHALFRFPDDPGDLQCRTVSAGCVQRDRSVGLVQARLDPERRCAGAQVYSAGDCVIVRLGIDAPPRLVRLIVDQRRCTPRHAKSSDTLA
jgi:hypothetical protein